MLNTEKRGERSVSATPKLKIPHRAIKEKIRFLNSHSTRYKAFDTESTGASQDPFLTHHPTAYHLTLSYDHQT